MKKFEGNGRQTDHLDMRVSGAVSSTDQTGMIPANPRREDMNEYNDIASPIDVNEEYINEGGL